LISLCILFIPSQKLDDNVVAGHILNNPSVSISFPTDNSKASQQARIHAAVVTLQNLNEPGKGCPDVSTMFSAQSKAIDAQPDTPAASAKTPAAAPTPAPAKVTTSATAAPASKLSIDPTLVPPFGFQSGVNPTGVSCPFHHPHPY